MFLNDFNSNKKLKRLDIQPFFDDLIIKDFTNLEYIKADLGTLKYLEIINAPNLVEIDCGWNDIHTVKLDSLPNLQILKLESNLMVDLDLSKLGALADLDLFSNQRLDFLNIQNGSREQINLLSCRDPLEICADTEDETTLLAELAESNIDDFTLNQGCSYKVDADIVFIPDAGLLDALINDNVDRNSDNRIQISEAEDVSSLHLLNGSFTNLQGLEAFINLESLSFSNLNRLDSILLDGYPILKYLYISNLPDLEDVIVTNLPELEQIQSSRTEKVVEINLSDLPKVTTVSLRDVEKLNNLGLDLFPTLTYLGVSSSDSIKNIDYSKVPEVSTLVLEDLPQLNNLEINTLNQLKTLVLKNLKFEEINLSFSDLSFLDISDMDADIIDLYGQSSLKNLILRRVNPLDTLFLSAFSDLRTLELEEVSSPSIQSNLLDIYEMNIIKVDSLNEIIHTGTSDVEITIDSCSSLKSLDFNMLSFEEIAITNNDSLRVINMQNNRYEGDKLNNLGSNKRLKYICVDPFEQNDILDLFNDYSSIFISIDCSETPDELYCFNAKIVSDFGFDGCDPSDRGIPFAKFSLSESTSNDPIGFVFADTRGSVNTKLDEGNYTVVPCFTNVDSFELDPININLSIPASDTSTNLICATPKSMVEDIDISIVPLDISRPGFENSFEIILNNTGTVRANGTVNISFPDSLLDLIGLSETPLFQQSDSISWQVSNLDPFTPLKISLDFRLNSPMDVPPLNDQDILRFKTEFIATNFIENDTFRFRLNERMFNSFDPNDIRCLQGRNVSPDLIEDFLYFKIRFENTGSASAVNINVVDTFNVDYFFPSSLQVIEASHEVQTSLSDENIVLFNFENINLSHIDSINDGYVVFKIKPNSNLSLGDEIFNRAAIYFDFNFPIITNNERVKFAIDNDNDGYNSDEDCDDTDASINPNATELCDDIDNNCDGQIDEDLIFTIYYTDQDGDGYGDETTATEYCSEQPSLVTQAGDCDDSNPDVNPKATEILDNEIDEDCDGIAEISTSIRDLEDLGIKVFPNPVRDLLQIKNNDGKMLHIEIYDLLGNRVITKQTQQNESDIDLESLSPSTFIMKISIDGIETAIKLVRMK